VRHLRNIDAFPEQRDGALLVLNIYALSDLKFASSNAVERDANVEGQSVHVDGEDVALGDGNGARRRETVAHADGILNVLSRGLEDFVGNHALSRSALDRAEKDEPHGEREECAEGGEGNEDGFRQGRCHWSIFPDHFRLEQARAIALVSEIAA